MNINSDNYNKGIKYAVITAIISGFSIFVNKFAVTTVSPAIFFTGSKNLAVAVIITSILLFRGKLAKLKDLDQKQIKMLMIISIIGGTIPFYLFFNGLTMIPAINAAILNKTLIFWVVLLAVPVLKEKLSIRNFLAVSLLFASNFVIGGFKGFEFSKGELMVLASSFFWGVEYVIAKKTLSNVSSEIVAFFRMGVGSVLLLLAGFLTAPQIKINFSQVNTFWYILTALFLTAYVLNWYKALKYAPAITVVSILVSSTIITNLLSGIFITHSLTSSFVIQSFLILSGIFIIAKVPGTVQEQNLAKETI